VCEEFHCSPTITSNLQTQAHAACTLRFLPRAGDSEECNPTVVDEFQDASVPPHSHMNSQGIGSHFSHVIYRLAIDSARDELANLVEVHAFLCFCILPFYSLNTSNSHSLLHFSIFTSHFALDLQALDEVLPSPPSTQTDTRCPLIITTVPSLGCPSGSNDGNDSEAGRSSFGSLFQGHSQSSGMCCTSAGSSCSAGSSAVRVVDPEPLEHHIEDCVIRCVNN
jgi:hypothetical protein